MKTLLVPCAVMTAALSSFSFSALAEQTKETWRGQSIEEFDRSEDYGLEWQIVNDGVMGGLSKGRVEISDEGIMRFSGTLSLENNGGFSMVRSEAVDFNLSNDLGMLLKVKGDGRTYEFRAESDATYRGRPVSFAGKFSTTKGQWQQVKIPFSKFEGSWRGTDLPDAEFNPAVIRQVGILLADKQPGSFDLEVDWIRTYGKGQGDFVDRSSSKTETVAAKEAGSARKVIDTIAGDERFSILEQALNAAGIATFFQWDNPKTVFAPSDEAFAALPEGKLDELLKPENKDQLVAILSYHVHSGSLELPEMLSQGEIETVEGNDLSVKFAEGSVLAGDARIQEADLNCSDGVIHVVDSVLLPPTSGI